MKKTLTLAALLVACGPESDPARDLAEVVACDVGAVDRCAAACVGVPFDAGPGSSACRIEPTGSDQTTMCSAALAFDIDGVRGCCDDTRDVDGTPTLMWRECLD